MKEDSAKTIGNYEITETIHETAEGIIYRALESSSGNRVLIKKYYPAMIWSEEALDEFFNLASYLRFIEHEFLLSVLDIGKQDGIPYIVLKLIEG
jgi:serine/threonine protein kinase